MRFDFLTSDSWELANDKAKELFAQVGVDPATFEARCYPGLAAGLLEVFSGTASFLSHKRTLGVVTGQSWAQEAVLPYLLRENFQIKYFTIDQMQDTAAVMSQLESETSCVLWPEDHPITGELYELDAFEEELAKKRIFSVRLSHNAFRTRPVKLRPYAVRLCSVNEDLSVALLGSRFKTPPWIAPLRAWKTDDVASMISECLKGAVENRDAVKFFESSLSGGWTPFLKSDSRLWDRALITHPEKSGDEMMAELQKIQQSSAKPGDKAAFETMHLCRWNATMKNLDWWKPTPKPDDVRGLMALEVSLLSNDKVRALFGAKSP